MQVTISDAIRYIGVDDKDIDLFESQYVVPEGVSYNSYVILDEKIAVMDTAINKNLAENESNSKVTGLTYTITCTVSDTQTLTVKLDINYPVHRQDAFYKIKQWKLNTDTAFEENDTLNLIGGN